MTTSLKDPIKITWGGNLKSVDDQGILEGNAIVFGSEDLPDQSSFKDFFTDKTYIHPDEKFVTPLFLEHAMSYKHPIGKAIMYKTDSGWMATAELDMTNDVVKARFPEIKSGGWGFSTGSAGHIVSREERKNGTHHISQWAVAEISLTKQPAEKRALIHSVKSLDEYYMPFIEPAMTMEEGDTANSILNESLMRIIEMLISEIAKKHIEEFLTPQLEEIKIQLTELKSVPLPIGSDETTQQLTVLKSENEGLISSMEELQSSFNEKEALLDENLALLSEIQKQLDDSENPSLQSPLILLELLKSKWSEEFNTVNEKLTKSGEEVTNLTKSLHLAKEANRLLTKPNFNK